MPGRRRSGWWKLNPDARDEDPEHDLLIRSILREKRKRLLKRAGSLPSRQQQEGLKRWAATKSRVILKLYRGPNARRPTKKMLIAKYKDSELLSALFPKRTNRWLPTDKRRKSKPQAITLKNLSFVHDPIHTILSLSQVAEAECTTGDGTINFADIECLDVGPYLVLQAMWEKMHPVFRGGKITSGLQEVVEHVGLREAMDIAPFRNRISNEDIAPFPIRKRRPTGSSMSSTRHLDVQSREKLADELIDWIDAWLGDLLQQQLSRGGRKVVAGIVGEVLDNAERHSDLKLSDGDWAIAACLRRTFQGKSPIIWCHIAFLSIGATISESMQTCAPEVRQALNDYILLHRIADGPTEEALTVVYALQDGVTRMELQTKQGRGGTGLQDILEFFAAMAGPGVMSFESRMAIVSGNTCVLLKDPHLSGVRGAPGEPRQLWFNDTNSPQFAPDPSHVITLPSKLQGTLVTMNFPLDFEFMRKTAGSGDE